MNDQEAKVPKAECHWEAIDIFLFSNGQEYSPPRKYHLTSEELNWWDATLNYLARSHYGSSPAKGSYTDLLRIDYRHKCIELYTIDGRKIEGPLDLNDGMHYVAVVPPDAFVDTGYEKYLLKASRSWEKRQAKRTTDCKPQEVKTDCSKCACCPYPKICATQVDKCQLVGTCNNAELTTIKKSDENIAIESALTRPQRCSTPKLDSPNDQQPCPTPVVPTRQRPSIIRNFNKQSTGQHPSFAKPGPNKQLSKINKITSKNKAVLPKKITSRYTKINEHVNNVRAKNLMSHPPKSTSQPPPPTPVSSLVREPSSTCQKKTSLLNDKTFEATMSVLEEPTNDEDVIVVTANTKVCKSTSDVGFTEANTNKTNTVTGVDEGVSCYIVDKGTIKTAQTETEQQTNEQKIPDMNRPFYVSSKTKVIHTEQYTEQSQTNVADSKISLGDNYIAVINKRDAINMNLNIELQNEITESKLGFKESHFYDVRKISSIADIFKKYKSQTLPEALAPVESKSLQSVISAINESYTKVVIIQCSCCGTNTAVPRIDTVPVHKDENGFFVVMPGPTPTAVQGCACENNPENDKSISSDKILTELCKKDMAELKSEIVYPCVPEDVGVVMTVMHCGLRSRQDSSQKRVPDTCVLSKQVCIDESQRDGHCGQREKVELIECRNNSRTRLPCATVDSSTQTEWCCLLMQVKHHDDNHYSFHLPPLELVKYYSR